VNSNFLNQLNLTPQERRIVVVIFLVFIVVLNFLFVWPHFGEWGSINKQLEEMRRNMATYNRVIAQDLNPTNGYKVLVNKLSRLEGGSVMEHPVDPQIQLANTIRAQERKTGAYVKDFGQASVKTNEFFEEISTAINVESEEPQLVNFLYNMGLDPAMIRVARLDLKPADNMRYKLTSGITLTANYTKRPPASISAATSAKAVAGPRPAAAPGRGPAPTTAARPAGPPVPDRNSKHPTGPFGPGSNKRQPGGGKPAIPNRPMPMPRPGQGRQQPQPQPE
jgi:hypothetical protein